MPLPALDRSRESDSIREPPPVALIWLARLVALLAVCIAGYLLWASLVGGARLAGCGDDGGLGCESVLSSRWSNWLGIPVGLPAVLVYLTLLAALLGIGPMASQRTERDAWRILIPLATLAAGAASWFSALQLFELHEMCPYCMALHACGIALAAFVFWYIPLRPLRDEVSRFDPHALMQAHTAGLLLLLGLVGVAALIGGQTLARPPSHRCRSRAPSRKARRRTAPPRPSRLPVRPAVNLRHSTLRWRRRRPAMRSAHTALSAAPPRSVKTLGPKLPDRSSTGSSSSGPSSSGPSSTAVAKGAEPIPSLLDPLSIHSSRHRPVTILGGKSTIDVYELPILGLPDADAIVIELFDYTCEHCRRLHRFIQQARQRYGAQLAIVLLPNPMNKSCNRHVLSDQPAHKEACHYARLALAVWNAKPEVFETYHDWLMEPKVVPSVASVRGKAAELIGEAALEQALADEAISRRIEADGLIYDLAGHGTIPKLMTETFVASGQSQTAEQLFELLEKQIGLQP